MAIPAASSFTASQKRGKVFYLQIMAIFAFAAVSIFYLQSRFEQQLHNQRTNMGKSRWAFNRDPFQVNNVYPGEDAATTGKSIEQPQEVPDLNNKGIPILIPAGSNKAVNIPPLRTNQPKEGDIKNLVLSKQEPDESTKDYSAIIAEKIKNKKTEPRVTESASSCPHTVFRDYDKQPVEFSGLEGSEIECAVRCTRGNTDIGGRGCKQSKSWERTMENTGSGIGSDNHIAGNTRFESDVIIQYFSWAEYEFMTPPEEKTEDALVVALISNCGPQFRLQYLQKLMDNGVKVDSYGSCMNNKHGGMGGDGRLHHKVKSIIPKYKFTFAFENSETDDYVTEKLFGPLAAGSVPIYYGAPNGKKFAPNNHSVIFAQDFESPEKMAAFLKFLAKNKTAYDHYLSWKTEGPSKEFIALVDLSIVHSSCRYCIRSADIDRKIIGEVETGPFVEENAKEMEKYKGKNSLMLKIRERGTFYLRRIHIDKLTVKEVKKKILEKYNDPSKGDIFGFYLLWDRNRELLKTDKQIENLQYGDEIEVIFENPDDTRRGSYTEWNKKRKNSKN